MSGSRLAYVHAAGGFDIYEEDDVKEDVAQVEQKELIGDADLLTPTQCDSLYKLDEAGSTFRIALVWRLAAWSRAESCLVSKAQANMPH